MNLGPALFLARIILAAVFAVAGIAKFADLRGSRQAMRDFGVAEKFASWFGLLLPIAELVVAIMLVAPVTGWFGAWGAMVLLLIFIAGIAYNLAHGRTPDCHCFGQLHSAPAGWSTLARNLVLAAMAGAVVAFGRNVTGPSVSELLARLSVSQKIEVSFDALVFLLLIGLTGFILQLMTQQGRLLLRIEDLESRLGGAGAQNAARPLGLPIGSLAPAFALPDLDGETETLEALRADGKLLLLVFSDPGCGPCTKLLPDIGKWQREQAAKVRVALISRGTAAANRAKIGASGATDVLLQDDREVAQAYLAHGTPSAVVVRPDGTIASPLAQGADAIVKLMDEVLSGAIATVGPPAAPPQPAGLKFGETAPDFTLVDLAGKTVRLSDFRGSRTVVLFWRRSCGFCARMLPDLKAWENTKAGNGTPKLLVVSTGSVAENLGMKLRAPVVLDAAGMSVGNMFGAHGTPMAVLIDADGKIASTLAAGGTAVMALLNAREPAARAAAA